VALFLALYLAAFSVRPLAVIPLIAARTFLPLLLGGDCLASFKVDFSTGGIAHPVLLFHQPTISIDQKKNMMGYTAIANAIHIHSKRQRRRWPVNCNTATQIQSKKKIANTIITPLP